jgi:GTP cyclohydrolase II
VSVRDEAVDRAERTPPEPSLFARDGRADVQRAIAEFRAGRAVVVEGQGGGSILALCVEGLTPEVFADLRALGGEHVSLVVSRTRAAALGADGSAPAGMSLPASIGCERVLEIAGAVPVAPVAACGPLVCAEPAAAAAIELGKLAHLLPAVLIVALAHVADGAAAARALRVSAADVMAFRAGHGASLRRVSNARVPLPGAVDCEFVIFRDDLGEAWTMVRVGRPQAGAVVPVRLHSACLTGDAFGSLRCDCGDQLRMAIDRMAQLGGGMLLYLDQEGCGIGLANKMRAYRLQDAGLDTVDANTTLGFERDERNYDAAARMLRASGIGRIALLTNNPSKVAAMRNAGIEVVERLPLLAPVSGENRRYLDTKRRRAGHMLGDATEQPVPERA